MQALKIIALLGIASSISGCDGNAKPSTGVDADGDKWVAELDCDDTDDSVYPTAPDDVCDGIDNDCDGLIDEDAIEASQYFRDEDLDAYGNPDDMKPGCTAPAGYVADATDCDDRRGDINPEASEDCAADDLNCDGDPTAGALDELTWHPDDDSDTFGDPTASVLACESEEPAGYVRDDNDCDDGRADVNPAADEVCSSEQPPTDEDCDGLMDDDDPSLDVSTGVIGFQDIDEGVGDGYGDPLEMMQACILPVEYVSNALDCRPDDPDIHPDATEVCDGDDNDCDGLADDEDPALDLSTAPMWYEDADFGGADGYGDPDVECEACSRPDGYVSDASDCDPDDGDYHPGAEEQCDGEDYDCDGVDDDGCWEADDATVIFVTMGDVDGDGKFDAIMKVKVKDCVAGPGAVCPTEAWVVRFSDGTEFGDAQVLLTDLDGSLAFEDSIIGVNRKGDSSETSESEDDHVYDHAWTGDLDADGMDDLVWLTIDAEDGVKTWRWRAARSNGSSWVRLSDDLYTREAPSIADESHTRFLVGDATGDGQVDLVVYWESTESESDWRSTFASCGDVDPDGSSEVVWVVPGSLDMLSTGSDSIWMRSWSGFGDQLMLGDVDDDGMSDYVTSVSGGVDDGGTTMDGTWYVATSNGAAFCDYDLWLGSTDTEASDCHDGCGDWADLEFIVDIDGDGRADAVGFYVDDDGDLSVTDGHETTPDTDGKSHGTFYVGVSAGDKFSDHFETERLMDADAEFGVDAYWDLREGGISRVFLEDVTGDGLPDAVVYDDTIEEWEVAVNTHCTTGTSSCASGRTFVETPDYW